MAVPTGQKSLAQINSEVTSVNSESLNTLTSNAIAYTGGNSTVVTNNLSATPNSMNEFSGYVHTQNFPTHTYVRYYNSNRSNTSDSTSSNPYKATTGSSNPSITITSSARTMTTTANNTDDFQAFASAGADFRVRRNSSYLYLECRNYVGGLPSARAMYRQNGTVQNASNGQVGVGDGTTLGNEFVRIMRIQTGISPGLISVMIAGSNSVTSHSVGTGGSANQYLSTLSGSQATVGNYSSALSTNNHYVGVRYFVQADQTAPPYGVRSTTASGARILTVNIRASGYYDQQIASIIVGGTALALGNSYSGCNLCCVHDSMLVSTEEDMKSVYDIEIGDLIVSHNFETGQDEIVPVTDKIIVDRDVDYKVNNLIMTEDHPVYLEDGRKASINPEATKINYKQIVDQLQIGDKMMTLDGLEEITLIEKYEGNHKNFALQTKHNNFYANGHLVDSVIDRGES